MKKGSQRKVYCSNLKSTVKKLNMILNEYRTGLIDEKSAETQNKILRNMITGYKAILDQDIQIRIEKIENTLREEGKLK